MNKNKKTKNVKLNKAIKNIENSNSIDTLNSEINNRNSTTNSNK